MTFAYLVVEGPHDVAFIGKFLSLSGLAIVRKETELEGFWEPLIPRSFPHRGDLLQRVPVPFFFQNSEYSVGIQNAAGDAAIPNMLEESLTVLGKSLDAIGVFLDADNLHAPTIRFRDLRKKLSLQTPNWPEDPGAVIQGTPRTGIFVFPDNISQGTIENILLDSAETLWPAILPFSKNLVEVALRESINMPDEWVDLKKPAGQNKAMVACISNLLKPGKAVQVSIQDNRWVSSESIHLPRLNAVQSFLQVLIGLRQIA